MLVDCWLVVGGWWLVVAGCWLLVAVGWWLVAGCWWLAACGWLVVGGWWKLVAGGWWLVAGGWLLVAGCWLLVSKLSTKNATLNPNSTLYRFFSNCNRLFVPFLCRVSQGMPYHPFEFFGSVF